MNTNNVIDFLDFIRLAKRKEALKQKVDQMKEAQCTIDAKIEAADAKLKVFTRETEDLINNLSSEYNDLEQRLLDTELLLNTADKQLIEHQIRLTKDI